MTRRTVLICGNGASAALLLSALARQAQAVDLSVVVIGTGQRIGEGIAYATHNPHHVLNVPAARMSAVPLQPDHFRQWLERRNVLLRGWSGQFVPRTLYADYLHDMVDESLAANLSLDVRLLRGEVISLIRDNLRWIISSNCGPPLAADIVILATGNDAPTPIGTRYPSNVARLIVDNPWGDIQIGQEESILILGSGLTAVDAVINLLDRGHTGDIHLLSRHGLLPAAHVPPTHSSAVPTPFPQTVRGLFTALRDSAGDGASQWQGLMDAMRPSLPEIWQSLADEEKRRFLRHAATLWNVHRHRLAPQIADRIGQVLGKTVHLVKGRLTGLTTRDEKSLDADIVRAASRKSLSVQRLINCTGPNSDPNKSHDPLIENLIASRQARGTAIRLGLEVDERNRVSDADGTAHPSLFAIGALTRGRWWEITAIPEISRQAADTAGHILAQMSILDAALRVTAPAAQLAR